MLSEMGVDHIVQIILSDISSCLDFRAENTTMVLASCGVSGRTRERTEHDEVVV